MNTLRVLFLLYLFLAFSCTGGSGQSLRFKRETISRDLQLPIIHKSEDNPCNINLLTNEHGDTIYSYAFNDFHMIVVKMPSNIDSLAILSTPNYILRKRVTTMSTNVSVRMGCTIELFDITRHTLNGVMYLSKMEIETSNERLVPEKNSIISYSLSNDNCSIVNFYFDPSITLEFEPHKTSAALYLVIKATSPNLLPCSESLRDVYLD